MSTTESRYRSWPVTYTDDEQREIKGLMDEGKTLEAQRLILDVIAAHAPADEQEGETA